MMRGNRMADAMNIRRSNARLASVSFTATSPLESHRVIQSSAQLNVIRGYLASRHRASPHSGCQPRNSARVYNLRPKDSPTQRPTMSIAVQSRVPVATSAGSQHFYVRMAAACVAVAFVGFAPTYWIPIARGTLDVAPITHVHAVFFYGWTLLFLRQTWLAANGEVRRHQALGVAGVALATGICFVGAAMAVSSLGQR